MGVNDEVAVRVGEFVEVALGVKVCVGVRVGSRVEVGDRRGGVGVSVGLGVSVAVAVSLAVGVAEGGGCEGVWVGSGVGGSVGVGDPVSVALGDAVARAVGDAVGSDRVMLATTNTRSAALARASPFGSDPVQASAPPKSERTSSAKAVVASGQGPPLGARAPSCVRAAAAPSPHKPRAHTHSRRFPAHLMKPALYALAGRGFQSTIFDQYVPPSLRWSQLLTRSGWMRTTTRFCAWRSSASSIPGAMAPSIFSWTFFSTATV